MKTNIRNNKGFTLIELLVVVSIIAILVVIAVPNLLRSRMSANEVAAIGGLKTINSGETDYFNNSNPHSFTSNLSNLGTGNGAGNVSFIDSKLASSVKSGYTFQIFPGPITGNNMLLSWSASAWPLTYQSTGIRSFYIDQSGVIRGSDMAGQPAPKTLPPID